MAFTINSCDELSTQGYTAYDVRAGMRDYAVTKLNSMGYNCTVVTDPVTPTPDDSPSATIIPPAGKSITDIKLDMNSMLKAWKQETAARLQTALNERTKGQMIDKALLQSGLVTKEKNEQDAWVPMLSPAACEQYKNEPDRNGHDRVADVAKLTALAKLVLRDLIKAGEDEIEFPKGTQQKADVFCKTAKADDAGDTLLETLSATLKPLLKAQLSQPLAVGA